MSAHQNLITLDGVIQAIQNIGKAPATQEERKARLDEELVRLGFDLRGYTNPSNESVYCPQTRYENYIAGKLQ